MPEARGPSVSRRALLTMVAGAALMPVVGCQATSRGDTGDTGDATASLQARLDALEPGATLRLDPREYAHGGLVTVRVPNVTIDGGNAATLRATNDETSAFVVDAAGVTVKDLTLAAPTEGKRWMGENQHKLVARGNDLTITNVTVVGSAGAGIYLYGVMRFAVRGVRITGTRADGLHMTGGSALGQVQDVRTDQTGDDGVAVVSYDHDAGPCHDIVIRDVTVGSTRWGRGVTVVGGHDVTITGFSIANTSSAGLYVANEGNPFYTRSVDRVSVADGSITGANWDAAIEQGSILVYTGNPGRSTTGVTISNVTVSATAPSAGRNVGIIDETHRGTAAINGIVLRDIHLVDTSLPASYANVPGAGFTATGWTLNGKPVSAQPN